MLERARQLEALVLDTPTVPIDDADSGCTLWVKLEYLQPSGSTKDRFAAFVLAGAIRAGEVNHRSIVVEASSGSTSIALAMACAFLGLRFRAVMPEGVSAERVLIIRRYGGDVVSSPTTGGVAAAMVVAEGMAAEDANVFLPRQFSNPANAEAHQRMTGPELVAAVDRTLDGFVAGIGTGGTLMGVARALRSTSGHDNSVICAVRPTTGSGFVGQPEICAGFSAGIPGVVEGMSTLINRDEVRLGDDIDVTDEVAVATARELCRAGFPVGLSSGLNVAGARVLAKRLGPGHHVATVLCDRMERYFSTGLFDDLSTAT